MKVPEDPELREALRRIVEHEKRMVKKYESNEIYEGLDKTPYWEMLSVPVEWKHLRKLILSGIVNKFGKKYYYLTDREVVEEALEQFEQKDKEREEKLKESLDNIPTDLFDVIEEFDDIKKFVRLVLNANNPVHVLFVGPPGTAKSLFLMELERLGGRFITAGTATKVGIRDIIFEETPRILIIDEIGKIESSGDLSALLTWMESGRIIITKHGMKEERTGKGWVFAAANTTKKLPPELLDRFQVFHIPQYSEEQFRSVVVGYLTKRCDVKRELAEYIADKVGSKSVREAIRISRLAGNREEVDEVVKVTRRYKE